MQLPLFYTAPINYGDAIIVLNEENSKHIVQVLRMQEGRQIKLTDGNGNLYTTEITDAHKKHCTVKIIERNKETAIKNKVCIAISPVKNNSRFEWFLEKATEIGIAEIVPIICSRTEKSHLRYDRMNGILISAMLQSQQAWLPLLHEPIKYEKYVEMIKDNGLIKYIAHCEDENKTSLKEHINQSATGVDKQQINQSTILIGPEGDFTKEEIAFALQNNFMPVALGNSRLRTETAALVAATLLCVA